MAKTSAVREWDYSALPKLELRSEERIPLKLSLELASPDRVHIVNTETINVSCHGFACKIKTFLDVEQEVTFKLDINGQLITGLAECRWSHEGFQGTMDYGFHIEVFHHNEKILNNYIGDILLFRSRGNF